MKWERVYRKHGQGFHQLPSYFPWYQRLSKSPQLSAWECLLYLTPPPSHSSLLIPMSSFPSPRRRHIQWNNHLYDLVSSLTNPSSPHCSLFKPQTHQYSRVRETESPSLWLPRASATQRSAHYKPEPVQKIPLNCKAGMVLKIPEEQERSHKTHTYSFRILSATFVINLVFPLLTLPQSWHRVLLKIHLILGMWTSKTVLLKITITNNFYNHESYKNKRKKELTITIFFNSGKVTNENNF